ncbi:MAG TPA: O-antigen ligase family protein [Candidatus Angelobacter sp.]
MLPIFYFVTMAVLAVLALTRQRILILCGFYCFYALLTVLDQDNVPHLGPVTIYRALYLIILVSLVARLVQDPSFLLRVRRWPLASYCFLLILILASALYTRTGSAFSSDANPTVWDNLAIISMFWMAASQVQKESDLKIMAGTTAAVSLALCVWVIWNAAQLNFAALRGGIEANQNYVSQFVVAGAIPLIGILFMAKRRWVKLACLPILLCVMLGALILASRGMIAALAVGVVWMMAGVFRGRRRRTMLGAGVILILIFGVALLLPGSSSFFERFQEGNLGTLSERTIIWSLSLKYFTGSSWGRMVFGQGLSSPDFVIAPSFDLLNYHNQYLKYLIEQGVLGAAAFLIFLYSVARRVVQCRHPLKPLLAGWLGFLIVAGLSSTIADYHQFWILLGMTAGVCALPDTLMNATQPADAQVNVGPRGPHFHRVFGRV